MKNVSENELLSAYLDGELAAEEQAEVERLLAESQEARQLLDQLRTLGATLRSMPQHKLDEDLSRRVLKLVLRRSSNNELGATAVSAVPLRKHGQDARGTRQKTATLRRFLTPRALAWSSLAVAVAVMLTVFDRGELRREADEKIAMAPPEVTLEREAGEVGEANETDEPLSIRPLDEDRKDLGGIVDAEYPAKAKEEAGETEEHRAEPAETRMFGFQKARSREMLDESAPAAPTAAGGAAESSLRTKAELSRGSGAAAATPADAPMMDKLAAPSPSEKKRAAKNGEVTALDTKSMRKSDDKIIKQQGGVLLVQCDVSPKTVKDQTFDKLLISNNIAWEKKDRTQTAALDVIYVEATTAQIEATISQLAAQPEQFLSVSVEPAPGKVSQQNLSRFNRSRGRQQSPPRLKRSAESAQMKRLQVEQEQLRRPAPKCQTLFVLRVVDIKQD